MGATRSLQWPLWAVTVIVILSAHGAQSRSRLVTSINKWFKVACIAEHIKETDHYICDSQGYVHCLPGWTDEKKACTQPVCNPTCSENGNCTRPNTCTCEVGWSGADCSKCVTLPGCVNGDCRLPFECICQPGWHGMLCNKPNCKEGCAHGTCSMPGECICHPGWTGENCDVCVTLPGCDEEHGYCDKPMQCECKPGWTGNFCTEPVCREGCHRHYGWCDRPDDCWCRAGWTGPNCDECMKYPGCQNGGCEQPWECNCAPGWEGMLCNSVSGASAQPLAASNPIQPTSDPLKDANWQGDDGGSLNAAAIAAQHRNQRELYNSAFQLEKEPEPEVNLESFFDGGDDTQFPNQLDNGDIVKRQSESFEEDEPEETNVDQEDDLKGSDADIAEDSTGDIDQLGESDDPLISDSDGEGDAESDLDSTEAPL